MNIEPSKTVRSSLNPLSLAQRLHRDERGSLSVMGVFAIFFLTVLLGMIFNVGRQVDDKLRMQNAADAAAYSGTLTVSRGMNAIAYSNHLLCEVFALTAYMREARLDKNRSYNSTDLADSSVLETWKRVAEVLLSGETSPPLDKFHKLGEALLKKIELERKMVGKFREMSRVHSDMTLSVFEYILSGGVGPFPVENAMYQYPDPARDESDGFEAGLITRFQRSVYKNTPRMAQGVAEELARRHGESTQDQHRGRELTTVLYRTNASRFDEYQEDHRDSRLLPVIDPTFNGNDLYLSSSFDPRFYTNYSGLSDDQIYFKIAYDRRTQLAKSYLEQWIDVWIDEYFTKEDGKIGRQVANLSQLANLWRVMTCGQLDKLLHDEFPKSNLPFIIRVQDRNNWDFSRSNPRFLPDDYTLETEYNCVAVVAWPHARQFGPGIYRNPLNGDQRTAADDTYAFTFAQARFFLPHRRYRCCPWADVWYDEFGEPHYHLHFDNWPRDWSTFNQNWRTKLVPSWTEQLPAILARHPGEYVNDLSTPNYRRLTVRDIHLLNSH